MVEEVYSRVRRRSSELILPATQYSDGVAVTNPDIRPRIVTGEKTSDILRDRRVYQLVNAHNKHLPRGQVLSDVGGPFESVKFLYDCDKTIYRPRKVVNGSEWYRYEGVQLPKTTSAFWTAPAIPWQYDKLGATSGLGLDALGSTAISRVAPTNPHSSVLNALIELYRDGLPAAINLNRIARGSLKDGAEEYLNYEFGILPTISDIKSIGTAYLNADKILRQYYRDSGRAVRRRYEFPPTEEVVSDVSTSGMIPAPGLVFYLYQQPYGVLREVITVKRRRWFSGSFTYHAEAPSSATAIRDQIQMYNHLYGIDPSPEVLWNALPYSWAADWIANVGDVLNNVAMMANDGLVMQYGYMMEHIVLTVDRTHEGTVLNGNLPVHARETFTVDYKRRRRATPFGFGLDLSGFTDRQWTILAALGISRGRGAL